MKEQGWYNRAIMSFKPERKQSSGEEPLDLCNCTQCTSKLVQPIDWSLVGKTHWLLERECPSCGDRTKGVFSQEAVDRYDGELEQGVEDLRKTLRRVTRSVMESELEQFTVALAVDAILPEDFGMVG